ncbi:M1 family metallopeptidase [Tamlana sp. 62-3]|uniref:Aminopeptidase N n=1 Tax=Neotamlana sargassicola TaxID=2883125 RepID=A0A9X1L717_9FLAO|nr:M1 family metallopeptidase [Tamlana sargassicola]MCB4808356.1 M1 family metallopeptidase [Tamlana sargassicola]
MKNVLYFVFGCFCWFGFSQQTDYVDFKSCRASIAFGNLQNKEVKGKAIYELKILKDTDSVFLDAQNFSEIKYILNDAIEGHLYDGKHLIVKHKFKAKTRHKLEVIWETSPKKAMYFIDWHDVTSSDFEVNQNRIEKAIVVKSGQIWTQGQGKYTSNWLPSIDDMNDKIEFDLNITFYKDYQVIANGKLIGKEERLNKTTWHYDMRKPMSSYLVALAIGKYKKKVEIAKSGIPLEMYYYPEDSSKVEPTYRYTKQMFDFLEDEIGVAYPWQNYKQVPVKDFLYAGMENTSCTVFSDAFMVDDIGFVDKNYVNVNAHELAHQWFGDLVTETSGTHHWLQEGFATYYALLAEKDVFGENHYYWQLYEYAQELYEQDKAGAGTSLLNPKASSTTFYKRGAWVLHALREKVGDKPFKKAVKSYLKKHKFENVETNDFINEVEKYSKTDLSEFVETWLMAETFNYDDALQSLKKSAYITEYLMVDCEVYSSKCVDYLKYYASDEAKAKVVSQIPNKITATDFKNPLKVRQAIAKYVTNISPSIRTEYESLLDDKSYVTIEAALFNLWRSFPPQRQNYLNKTKEVIGFNDKNVRLLWLTLALVTEDYEPENKTKYLNELTNYTSPNYGYETRMNAFQYLHQIKACNAECLSNLEQATTHHNWRMVKFAKQMLSVIKPK